MGSRPQLLRKWETVHPPGVAPLGVDNRNSELL